MLALDNKICTIVGFLAIFAMGKLNAEGCWICLCKNGAEFFYLTSAQAHKACMSSSIHQAPWEMCKDQGGSQSVWRDPTCKAL
jgi:hypothetical protein